MDPTGQQLLKLLFNSGENVCCSPNKYGFHSFPLENALNGIVTLISPNQSIETRQCNSSDLILCAINPIDGFRLDRNVTAYRSFLLEIDVSDIKSQLGYIKQLGIPFSAQVFSGNKSIHTVICLDEDLPDLKMYSFLAQWMLRIVTYADKNCANPSRSCRIPGAYRELGKKQRLVTIKKRVSHEELFTWLNRYEHLRPKAAQKKIVLTGAGDFDRLSPWAKAMLTKGVNFKKGRNQGWFGLSYDLALAGFTIDQATEILLERFVEEHDFKEKELLICINSAYKIVSEGK